MSKLFNSIMRSINGLDSQEWGLVLAGMILVGLVCMRGFGSRSEY